MPGLLASEITTIETVAVHVRQYPEHSSSKIDLYVVDCSVLELSASYAMRC